ncbi:hypothetical protein KAX02_13710 [candidate division WOR-3 bacterium]|nr:hypothetical protein [candidate division WOR-3 bacterium]
MQTTRGGKFSFSIDADSLVRGLRPSKRVPRNSGYLIKSLGAVGKDGVLQVLDEITRLATTAITDGFPYPQIFVFTNVIIICGETKIYEWIGGSLVLKLTVAAGSTWTAVDFFDYVYMSNEKVAVIRRSEDKIYTETTDLPTCMSACNFNGQVIIGAPNVGYAL